MLLRESPGSVGRQEGRPGRASLVAGVELRCPGGSMRPSSGATEGFCLKLDRGDA